MDARHPAEIARSGEPVRTNCLAWTRTAAECVDRHFPPVRETSTIISSEFEAWYPPDGLASRAFYWDQYKKHLVEAKNWHPDSVAGLDEDTAEGRRADQRSNADRCLLRPRAWWSGTYRAGRPPTSLASSRRRSTPATASSSSWPARSIFSASRRSVDSTWNWLARRTSSKTGTRTTRN